MSDYDATNPKHVAIQRRSAQADQDARDAFLRHAMGMVDGRRYFYWLLNLCHLGVNPFTRRPDADGIKVGYDTAFVCGELNIGQQVLAEVMRVADEEYIRMTREANARELDDRARRSRSDADSRQDDSRSESYVHPAYDTGAKPTGNGGGAEGLEYNPVEREDEGS